MSSENVNDIEKGPEEAKEQPILLSAKDGTKNYLSSSSKAWDIDGDGV